MQKANYKTSDQIREEFLQFFKEKGHLIVNSSPVVPQDDPTLLFINAGMNQFKPVFLGEQEGVKREGKIWKRVADTQKCIRVSGKHNDLEEVGHDTYHHTLFEMLGNWSFGDYFKKEAIEWAWELLVDRWGLEPDRLYATVFEGNDEEGLPVDSEAVELWKNHTTINPDHILLYGKEDNFWEMGETGPCGPCSEVHIDLRPEEERKKVPGSTLVNRDDPRVMEIWNLVFIQFNRLQDGSLQKLPDQHVDTGMGFERICAVLQGKTSNYDTDIFQPVIGKLEELSGRKYGENEETDIAMRVIADHIRAVSFAIADGASPSNDGRGYVIRRILRRAVRYGWDRLDFEKPFMSDLVPVLATQFKHIFPELDAQSAYLQSVIHSEEKSFLRTLGQGIDLFHKMVAAGEGDDLSGDDAFKLHDTYGFPIDLTQLMAREEEISVDVARFEELMDQQRKRARESGRFGVVTGNGENWRWLDGQKEDFEFTGYDLTEDEVVVRAFKKSAEKGMLLLNRSPFYAESGGQIADTGSLIKGDQILSITDVQKSPEGYIHYTDNLADDMDLSGQWIAKVDRQRRREIEKHHSATHLMHAAMREVLGTHVTQKGSLVEPSRLRFDFSHFEAVSPEELDAIEQRVNEKIMENIALTEEREVPLEEAKKRDVMMLFGEKYGEYVRIVTFDPGFSSELCGGTHVSATGNIGYFRFTTETSVAAGVRRVEAVAGEAADALLREEKHRLGNITRLLGNQNDPEEEIQNLIEKTKQLEKELKALHQKQAAGNLNDFLNNAVEVEGIEYVTGELENVSMDDLKQMGYQSLQKKSEKTVTVLASVDEEERKVYLMVSVTDDLVGKGAHAGKLVSDLGKLVGGGGGGQPGLATAGGRFPEKTEEVFSHAREWIKGQKL